MLTLNVIVKCAVFVTVSLQQLECIVVAKVFKLNQCVLTISIKVTNTFTCCCSYCYYYYYSCCRGYSQLLFTWISLLELEN